MLKKINIDLVVSGKECNIGLLHYEATKISRRYQNINKIGLLAIYLILNKLFVWNSMSPYVIQLKTD
ncbi:hypothetical protein AOB46_01845 [Chryseobacterium indologenes]|uniref:Uncharacterized protein n=1 Tax=Chryseobacterium indologenes TaxID=253 RepID=A0A0N0ZWG7_CHRID|nr:hypothetical protein AOB46_01845 [Chryseobacterium indologenes]